MTHQRGSGKQTPLLLVTIVVAGTVGMLGGHNGPDNQPAECPSLFPAGGVSGDSALEPVDAS